MLRNFTHKNLSLVPYATHANEGCLIEKTSRVSILARYQCNCPALVIVFAVQLLRFRLLTPFLAQTVLLPRPKLRFEIPNGIPHI